MGATNTQRYPSFKRAKIVVAFKKAVYGRLEVRDLNSLRLLLGLIGQQDSLDVRQHSSLSDRNSGQQLVQLLVVSDGELKVTRDDPSLLVVSGSVACQLEHFGGQVLHDGRQVYRGAGTDSFRVVALAE